jgi:hypothetical protein
MRTRLFAAVPLALACLAAIGCGPKKDPNTADLTNPCPPGQICPQPTTTVTAPPTSTVPAPTATTTSTAPAGSSATPVPALGTMAVTPLLQAMGGTEAPGMKPDGNAFAGNFQEGQTLEQPINIQAGKCYTVVGASIGITQLEIQLVAQAAPLPPVVLAQSSPGAGPNATLGGKGSCFKNPLPLGGPGKVILKAAKGTGMAGAQIFVK